MGVMNDHDPAETQEWVDALRAVLQHAGPARASYLLGRLRDEALQTGAMPPFLATTPYRNTIAPAQEAKSPGDRALEHKIRAAIRWNAVAIILRANKESSELGGHIASFQSSALLYDIGFGHFWHAPTEGHGGDLLYVQGHVSPGIYARAFVEGRLTEQQLLGYRQESEGKGIPSYPHPWLMPDFWQFPTVSMGLGPLMAIYQARFLKYLEGRGLAKTDNRKVWAFLGDGECDEPESLGAISMGGREGLDNLIFVINCNLQRLDGPVRGNGKIIQELEGVFRGAGWNVIKVVWGSTWDPLFAKDQDGILLKRMEECVDGQYQDFKSKNGAYVREHFFNSPELKALVADLSDDEVWKLSRGGHDPFKVYAAYAAAVAHRGQPTVILAKTVKGYGMGESGEGQMISHQAKKMTQEALKQFRDRFDIPMPDDKIAAMPFLALPPDSPELKYLHERRAALGGYLPQRRQKSTPLPAPPLATFERLLKSSAEREISTTMAFVQMLGTLVRDKALGKHIVPIVPDESRTFGMEGMFRQLGIYSSVGQLYKPQDADQLMYYREDKAGQVLQEGINEAGAMSSWIAAATSYSTNNVPMIPFYIYYSMFGLQRVGDLAWLAGDMRARGFLLGGTAGRTTLNGEGLQHEDGHSHILASTIPNCVAYDPTFAYEVVVIIRDGIRRMVQEQEDVYYYVTLMNENYPHPGMPEGAEAGIIKGLYLLQAGAKGKGPRVQLMGSGTILREVMAAAELLRDDFKVNADIWSATSFNELRRDGMSAERWSLLHPSKPRRKSYLETTLDGHAGPVVAATDYMRAFAEQVRGQIPRRYVVLGTDGFGRSDYRVKLRQFFEVNRYYVAVAALKALADDGEIKADIVDQAIRKYGLDTEQPDPWTVETLTPVAMHSTRGDMTEVKVPDIGDFKDIPIIEVMVKVGDTVKAEDPLISLESDKATMEVPAPAAGVVKALKVALGDKVSEGSVILLLESGAAEAAAAPKTAVSSPPAPTSAPGGVAEVRVPDIGDFKDIPVIEVFVKAGDTVKAEDPLISLESDKATMDVPSPLGGTVREVRVKVGDKVSEGAVVLLLATGGGAATTSATPAAGAAATAPAAPAPGSALPSAATSVAVDDVAFGLAYAGPAVRKLARELGVDLGKVKGSGNKGRIQKEDVEAAAKGAPAGGKAAPAAAAAGSGAGIDLLPWPKVDFAKFGPIETVARSRIKKISAANLHRNWVMIPHVTNHDDADITDLEAFRVQLNKENEKSGAKVSMLAFMIKAAVSTLKKFPEFNASLDGDNLILKQYWHIGFAADTPNGLVVPVIRDADKKGVIAIAQEMGELAKLARDGKLKPDQMQGGTFTISSLGGIGGIYFTPIINAPEVAIMGVCRSFWKQVSTDGKTAAWRFMLPLSLSWDHRVIDGAAAARFNNHFASLLADMRRVLV